MQKLGLFIRPWLARIVLRMLVDSVLESVAVFFNARLFEYRKSKRGLTRQCIGKIARQMHHHRAQALPIGASKCGAVHQMQMRRKSKRELSDGG